MSTSTPLAKYIKALDFGSGDAVEARWIIGPWCCSADAASCALKGAMVPLSCACSAPRQPRNQSRPVVADSTAARKLESLSRDTYWGETQTSGQSPTRSGRKESWGLAREKQRATIHACDKLTRGSHLRKLSALASLGPGCFGAEQPPDGVCIELPQQVSVRMRIRDDPSSVSGAPSRN
ncbi:hypothetical protein BD779DRAFT_1469491 [Infundibulicybe gibba]|nr:hypothetical protein BD779DRAFT_1469491 [Infundibulicybe gibba]